MTDPITTAHRKTLDPVQAGEEEGRTDRWTPRLVLFLRVMAAIALMKGLYHWAIVCGFLSPSDAGFEDAATPVQAATVFFGVIDLVAAVGLWLAAPWGAVVWLTVGDFDGGGRGAVSANLRRTGVGRCDRYRPDIFLSLAGADVGARAAAVIFGRPYGMRERGAFQ